MDFRFLGPVEVWADGDRVDLGRANLPKVRCLLAVLLRSPGELVSADALTERVWGDGPPSSPDVRYKYIGWLRAALNPYDVELLSRDGGYVLDVPPSDVDVWHFRDLVVRARQVEDTPVAVQILREADRLWRGEALADIPGVPWAQQYRDLLQRERRNAAVARFQLELAAQTSDDVVDDLARWHADHVEDEELTGLLMEMLYRDGHLARAIECYQRTAAQVKVRFGVEPGAQLREVYRRIQGNPRLTFPSAGPTAVNPVAHPPATEVGDCTLASSYGAGDDGAVNTKDSSAPALLTGVDNAPALVADETSVVAAPVRRHTRRRLSIMAAIVAAVTLVGLSIVWLRPGAPHAAAGAGTNAGTGSGTRTGAVQVCSSLPAQVEVPAQTVVSSVITVHVRCAPPAGNAYILLIEALAADPQDPSVYKVKAYMGAAKPGDYHYNHNLSKSFVGSKRLIYVVQVTASIAAQWQTTVADSTGPNPPPNALLVSNRAPNVRVP